MPGSTWSRIAYDHPRLKEVIHGFIDLLIPGDMFSMEHLIEFLATVPMHRYMRPAGQNRDNPIPVGTRPAQPNFNKTANRERLSSSGTYFAQVVMSHPFLFRGAFRSAKADDLAGLYPQAFYCKTDEAWNWVCVMCESAYQIEEDEFIRFTNRTGEEPRCFRRLIECGDCYDRYRFSDENLEDLV